MAQQPAAPIGVIGLDTAFVKIPGHIRNASTFDFPVIYEVVPGATPDQAVYRGDPALLQPVIRAARKLESSGAAAITTACGFLTLFQRELAAAVSVPLFSSSLIQLPMVYRMIGPGQKVGLLTASESALTRRHFAAVGAESVPVCIAGMDQQPEFREVILEGRRADLDPGRLEAELLSQVDALATAHPELGAIVLECTDLVPFAARVQQRTSLPVFDIVTLMEMMHRSLTRRPYRGPDPLSGAGTRRPPAAPSAGRAEPCPASSSAASAY